MLLTDLSVKRPVFATVMSLILIAFGIVAFNRLPLQEYPNIDPPVVSIETSYPGAAAAIVETKITKVIEDRIAGLEGIKYIDSNSQDGRSDISIEFDISRNIEAATNDIRDRVSSVVDRLPAEADPPEIQKVDSSDDVIMWLNLASEKLSVPELTDFAERYLVDRLSVVDGVARVRIGGAQSYSIRVWINQNALASRGLTTSDIETALLRDNIELPAGSLESGDVQFSLRLDRVFKEAEDFENLVISGDSANGLVRLSDVATVRLAASNERSWFRGNGSPMVGLGVVKQSTANTVAVAREVNAQVAKLNQNLPVGMKIHQSFDTSVFIEQSIKEVYITLFIAIILVILVIYLFIGDWRATLIPALTVPVSVIATFFVLYLLDFSINLLTLLALVLAIGLVVDDTIVVLENIVRRMQKYGESALVASFRGGREIGFAVVATTLVLVAVFVPIIFVQGDLGRLFSEFAITMAVAVSFSSFVALTLSPMLASKLLGKKNRSSAARENDNDIANESSQGNSYTKIVKFFKKLEGLYARTLHAALNQKKWIFASGIAILVATGFLHQQIPAEYAPKEDRGAFFVIVNGPEGATHEYMDEYMNEIESRLMSYIDSGEMKRLLVRTPRSFGTATTFNSGIVIAVMEDWSLRRSTFAVIGEIRKKLADLPGVRAFPIMRQALGGGAGKPVQFVLGGGTYEQLAEWRDIMNQKINDTNPGLTDVDWSYKETQPQLRIDINYDHAAELGVNVREIGKTLELMLGSRRVTTFTLEGQEYDVVLEGRRDDNNSPQDLKSIFVQSGNTGELIPLADLVTVREYAASSSLNRYNRVRAITLDAGISGDLTLGQALSYLEKTARETLPSTAVIDYKGVSQDFRGSETSIAFVLWLGLAVVFLVLAAQFESFIHPFVIMLSVPLAIFGALLGLYVSDGSLNIYSQIGLIVLIGLAAKNGILIVEFANQLRDQGMAFHDALMEASQARLRPILMTALTTAAGAIPLITSSGAGSETRTTIGIVILFGVTISTFMTLYLIPAAYAFLATNTRSPLAVSRQLQKETANSPI